MSALDQAFIKAYRRGADEPQHVAGLAPSLAQASTAAAWPPSAPATAQPVTNFDTAHANVRAPHAPFAQAAAQMRGAQQEWSRPTAPLSAFAPPPAQQLEPAYEVARFTWPRALEELSAEIATQLASVAALLATRAVQQRKVILVTGCQRNEGRSTLVLMLARAAASRGLHVAIVDADTRHPNLAGLMGIAPAIGWEDVLAGSQPLEEAMVESPLERITLLPLVGRPLVSESSATETMPAESPWQQRSAGPYGRLSLAPSIARLREHFDLVLLDVGPLESDATAIELATRLVGCTIDDGLICRDRSTQAAESLTAVSRRLAAAGVARWDVVDNFVDRGGRSE